MGMSFSLYCRFYSWCCGGLFQAIDRMPMKLSSLINSALDRLEI